MPDVPLRKRLAGSDSYGNVWPKDGSVVEVPYGQAMDLLAIPDGGFSVADTAATDAGPAPDGPAAVTEPDPEPAMDEVAPEPEQPVAEAPAKKATARRTTKS